MPLPAVAGIGTNVWSPPHVDGAASLSVVSAIFLGGLAINFALLSVWGVRRLFLEKPTFRRDWSYVDLWLSLQLILGLLVVGATPFLLNAKSEMQILTEAGKIFPLLFLQNALFFAVPAGFITAKYRVPLRQIGLPVLPKGREALLGIGLGLAAIVLARPLEMGLTALAQHYSSVPWVAAGLKMDESLPINAMITAITKQGWPVLLLAFLAIGPGPAVGEEMLFRGFLFNLLKTRLGVWPGILLSSLVFAAVHGYFIGFLPVFLLGMALAFTYQRTGSLWTSIFFHATNNGVLVLLAYFFPALAH